MAAQAMFITRSIIAAIVLGFACALISYLAAGHSLGFYLGSVAMIAIVVPPIAVGFERAKDSILNAGAVTDGVGIAWFIAVIATDVTLGQWLSAYLVLLTFAAALWALSMLLRFALGATLAAAVVVIGALAWLSWPIWLSPAVSPSVAAWLTPAHPLLALNRVFFEMGVWTEQRVMYQLTALGQDVPYALPSSVWPAVLVHLVIAAVLGLPAWWSPPAPHPPPTEASPAS